MTEEMYDLIEKKKRKEEMEEPELLKLLEFNFTNIIKDLAFENIEKARTRLAKELDKFFQDGTVLYRLDTRDKHDYINISIHMKYPSNNDIISVNFTVKPVNVTTQIS